MSGFGVNYNKMSGFGVNYNKMSGFGVNYNKMSGFGVNYNKMSGFGVNYNKMSGFGVNYNKKEEGNVLFNDALNTFWLRLYGVRHMVMDHSDSKRGNPLPPYGLLFPISSKGSFICIIPQRG